MAKKSTSASLNQVPLESQLLNSSHFVVSLDIGSQKITGAILRPDRSLVLKPAEFDNRLRTFFRQETTLVKNFTH